MSEYKIGDAVAELRTVDGGTAALIHLDDAWKRPHRCDEYSKGGKYGVDYPTHDFQKTEAILEQCHRVLEPGGWLIADADDYLLPRLIDYIRREWGDVAATYEGGGYRRAGSVILTTADGDPDRSTPGQYLSNGGYHVVFAHKGETSRRSSESARQIATRPRRDFGWAGVKPIGPYRTWVTALTEPGELIVEPCAGTAPAAIAADFTDRVWLAIDIEPEARRAFEKRRESNAPDTTQTRIG